MQTKKDTVTVLSPLVYLLFHLLLLSFLWMVTMEEICWLADEFCRAVCLFLSRAATVLHCFLLKPETKKRNTTYSSSPSKDCSCLLRPPNLITYNLTIAIVSFREHWSLCTVADLQIIVSIMYTEQSCSMRVLSPLW